MEHVADAGVKVSYAAKYRTGPRESPGVNRQRAARRSMPAIALARSAPLAAPAPASNASAVHGAAETGTATCLRRVSEGERRRDASGRLYASFDAAVVTAAMRNAMIVSDTETVNQSSGKRVRRLIVQRAS
nr:hypothetical protein [Burkholderia ubonensis]